MSFKKLGRIICGLAMAASISAAAVLSGCTIETKHPRAEITIEFNGTEYVIEYTLYRNMYPQTVRHFIELADAGFYDNTIIHDYTSTDWLGGGYNYIADEYESAIEGGDIASYLSGDDEDEGTSTEIASKEVEYAGLASSLTATVYTDYYIDSKDNMQVDTSTAYYTLRGEFEANGHIIDNGALSGSLGSLKMYYYSDLVYTTSEASAMVYVKTSKNETQMLSYKYNSATSLFSIQVSSSTSYSASSYCTFGELRNDDAEDTLNDLLDAIDDYISDNCDGDDDNFVQTSDYVTVNTYDNTYVDALTVKYDVPVEPIIIKSVKITKY